MKRVHFFPYAALIEWQRKANFSILLLWFDSPVSYYKLLEIAYFLAALGRKSIDELADDNEIDNSDD